MSTTNTPSETLVLPTCGLTAGSYAPYSETLRNAHATYYADTRDTLYHTTPDCPTIQWGRYASTGTVQPLYDSCTTYLKDTSHASALPIVGCHVCESVVAPIVYASRSSTTDDTLFQSHEPLELPDANTLYLWLYGDKKDELETAVKTFMALPDCQRWTLTERVCNQNGETTNQARTYTVKVGASEPPSSSASSDVFVAVWMLVAFVGLLLGIVIFNKGSAWLRQWSEHRGRTTPNPSVGGGEYNPTEENNP